MHRSATRDLNRHIHTWGYGCPGARMYSDICTSVYISGNSDRVSWPTAQLSRIFFRGASIPCTGTRRGARPPGPWARGRGSGARNLRLLVKARRAPFKERDEPGPRAQDSELVCGRGPRGTDGTPSPTRPCSLASCLRGEPGGPCQAGGGCCQSGMPIWQARRFRRRGAADLRRGTGSALWFGATRRFPGLADSAEGPSHGCTART
jgi:hypothetical protein